MIRLLALVLSLGGQPTHGDVRAAILLDIYHRNAETIEYRRWRGDQVTEIPKARARELAGILAQYESIDPKFFWGVWFPFLSYGAGFWNGMNDADQKPERRTWGYTELQEGTARTVAMGMGIEVPGKNLGPWLVLNWEMNLRLGYYHQRFLWNNYRGDDLMALNAYQCGVQGTADGVWGLKYRQLSVREDCLRSFGRIYGVGR